VQAEAGLGYMMEHDVADEIAGRLLVQVLASRYPSYPGCRLYHPDPGLQMLERTDALELGPSCKTRDGASFPKRSVLVTAVSA
jgi:hypothetical protein